MERAEKTAAENAVRYDGLMAEPQPHFRRPISSWRRFWQDHSEKLRFYLGEEEDYGRRFLLVPLFLGFGITVYFRCNFEPDGTWLGALCLFCGGAMYFSRNYRFYQLFCSCCLVICLGAFCAKIETISFSTPMLDNNGMAQLTLRIMAIEKQDNGSYRLLADTLPQYSPQLGTKSMRLRLSLRNLPQGARLGTTVQGLVFLRRFSGPVRPNGYDFAFHNYFRGISGQGNFAGTPQLVSLPLPNLALRTELAILAQRARITARIKTAIAGEYGAVAAALITGERAGISPTTNQALRLSGLAHILSISGLHMAMIAGMILLLFRKILALFPIFSSHLAPQKIAAIIALIAAAFYLVISGADIAAERSFIMIAVMLGAVICDRFAVSLRNLAISAVILMVWRPHEIMGPSFQMSFAATAALIASFDVWRNYHRKKREIKEQETAYSDVRPSFHQQSQNFIGKIRRSAHIWLIRPLCSTCLASLVAGAAGGVYSAYHFNNMAPFGIISNALALPIMSILVMPFALLGTMLLPFHLETSVLQLMGLGIRGVEAVAYWVAEFSPVGNLGVIPSLSLIFLTIGMVLFIFLRTMLRFSGLIFIVLGMAVYAARPLPLALVAENGHFAAVYGADKRLYLNEERASRFLAQIWQTAYAAKAVVPPLWSKTDKAEEKERQSMPGQFFCNALFCRAYLRNGAVFVSTDKPENQVSACRAGDIILLNFKEINNPAAVGAACLGKQLIYLRDLALLGAAELYTNRGSPNFDRQKSAGIFWSVGIPARAWNHYRRYGKSARGIPA